MGETLMDKDRSSDWENWLLNLAVAREEDLKALLHDGISRPPWVWDLAKDICGEVVSRSDMFWLLYRADVTGRHLWIEEYPIHTDLPLLQSVFHAAMNDRERWYAMEESIWLSEVLESGQCQDAALWVSGIKFADAGMQTRFIARILSSGILGTEVFEISPEGIDDFVGSVRVATQSDGVLAQMPDFVQLGMPDAFLVARALQDGRLDIARSVAVRINKPTWRSVLEVLPEWDSNSAWTISPD